MFDPRAVGMTPAEALLVDPQQRLVMEVFQEMNATATHLGVASR
jgi:acyl transferase domain-containing protein